MSASSFEFDPALARSPPLRPTASPSSNPTSSPLAGAASSAAVTSSSAARSLSPDATRPFGQPVPPTTYPTTAELKHQFAPTSQSSSSHVSTKKMLLELADGSAYEGFSFGAEKSIAGECVFQTGMVGYPESLTDPSYAGQILILTYPLIGSYGVPARPPKGVVDPAKLPSEFESYKIHVAGLVVGNYSGAGDDFSNHAAKTELAEWLKEEGIPAIFGVDTRDLTKKLRERGSTIGRLSAPVAGAEALSSGAEWRKAYEKIEYHDPNGDNLVGAVSTRKATLYKPDGTVEPLLHPSGRPLRVLCVDVGMKYNQIRCFIKRGVELKVVPYDYNYLTPTEEPFDGLFLSNGPGDPATLTATTTVLAKAIELGNFPIFGICLGHQLLARASGASTLKLKYGNRGANIPCTSLVSGRCYITSQNHGYAVDTATLKQGWKELFVNANDGSNEGIYSTERPFFSVQFHPESAPGPRDTEFLFDTFIGAIQKSFASAGKQLVGAVSFPGGDAAENAAKTPRVDVRKVLVLGSGGLSIGQAGEFDYSGSQAIKALKEEGIYTVLINPNIATIQTSKGLADKVYFLPVTADSVRKVIEHERPDGIYCTFGGQTALSVGIKLKDEFAGLGVKVLGTPIETIITTEDRELFASAMEEIGEKCAQSASAVTVDEAVRAATVIGYPVIVRAAFALGGLGSGFAYNESELVELCTKAFATSSQVLVEKSMKGWKEIEYEVVRDCRDNCITVCNMENFDPLGIHTGDSIVVAPSQTLSDSDYNMLRTTAVNVIRHLGVVGECNIQYALNPHSQEYCIIEVNARLSRSSALASKATGYPLAFIAAKLGLNIPLNEIRNSVTKNTSACFEPSLDYIVVKIPRWDLKKFTRVSTALSSSMKSVGEVMAIGKTFEETMQKAIRAIDPSFAGFGKNSFSQDIDEELKNPSDQRVFAIANAMHSGRTVEEIHDLTKIDKWFLRKLEHIVDIERIVSKFSATQIPAPLLRHAKQMGFADAQLAKLLGSNELAVRRVRTDFGITPRVKQIDTVAAEFPCFTNYLYTTYNAAAHDVKFEDKGIMVLGSGVYRIGSSVEFDWCAVRAIRTIRDRGFKTVMVNYNPETVSTDYDEADRLYFEVISLETILDIYEVEASSGVVVSMGGQTSNNIALPLHRQGVKILGTSPEMIDMAENRYKFSRMLDKIGVDQPLWKELSTIDAAHEFCDKVGYPVLVRPSYVLSGAAMNVVYSSDDLNAYLSLASAVSREYPVVVTKYIEEAKEIEMDAVARDGKLVMHYISEHVENAGVHSGDATLILPPQDLDPETVRRIEVATAKIAASLNVSGPFNIQFIAKNNEIKVIECNVRAARSYPFVSKVTGIDAIELATDVMLGLPVEPYPQSTMPADYVGIKVPQFSFGRLAGADPILGVEMASTGEVACFGKDKYEAYLKALLSTGMTMPKKNVLFSIGSFKEKLEMLPSVQKLHTLGYNIFATAGTSDFLQEHGVPVKYLEALEVDDAQKSEYSLNQHIANNLIDLYINLPSKNRYRRPASYMSKGYRSRRMAVDFAVPLVTNVKCAKLLIEALARRPSLEISSVDFKTSHRTITLPGFINTRTFIPNIAVASTGSAEIEQATEAALAGGFTTVQLLPIGTSSSVEDALTLDVAEANAAGHAHCDYALSIAATVDNSTRMNAELIQSARSLFLPFTKLSDAANKVSAISAHFSVWPLNKPIVTDAKTVDLASVLLVASLHGRSVHVSNVQSQADIALIALSKEKELKVTCDVSVYSLFLSAEAYPKATCLPSAADQAALWSNMATIDTLSVGALPYRLATELGLPYSPRSGMEESTLMLLSAVQDGRLTIEDLTARLSDNPRAIFDLPAAVANTYVEVEIDRATTFARRSYWSPLEGQSVAGAIHRVVLRGDTAFLDGTFFPTRPAGGRNISALAGAPKSDRKLARFSMSSSARPSLQSLGFPSKPFDVNPSFPVVPSASSQALTKSPKLVGSKSPRLDGNDGGLQPSFMGLSLQHAANSAVVATRGASPTSSLTTLLSQSSSVFSRRHVLSVRSFNRDDLHALFGVASELRMLVERQLPVDLLRGRVLCTLFYEPSTRTSSSFEAAMCRLGGQVVAITPETSSVTKGESLADTVRTLGCYGDAIVLRHPAAGSAQTAAKFSPVPILNAGDGIGEHPTQASIRPNDAFLDIYTIREELGTVNGLTITMVGDLKNGRTVHSLVRLLSQYSVSLNFVSPASLSMPESVKEEAIKAGVPVMETTSLASVIGSTDVLYVTRTQQERFASVVEYEAVKDSYIINNEVLASAKPNCIVLHPLPRNAEVDPEVDFDQRRAAYFRQMRYGLFVRMALLLLVLN
ncbi:BZ3500_MvSof-1268-A1-R1_Chr2-2g05005 [Microbotryum saponariae]|uniref:BZ3500_MvSof-1268-A1-R1_Chr2-2g05005 protein n=1 Tax=Microbotryum saponariae TaxID=289078 RepID=A0A2X0K587_9BASI|nr:BZ3500_MvSof-1268-A1-R1_Chr2-2g05005 [Microbotryum saponariae]SDA00686.1 BZ3501_MvSof-1269-A2-R1_Chr2-2g04679 [Microbotryum saponariae]